MSTIKTKMKAASFPIPANYFDRRAGLISVPWDGYLKYFKPKVQCSTCSIAYLTHFSRCSPKLRLIVRRCLQTFY